MAMSFGWRTPLVDRRHVPRTVLDCRSGVFSAPTAEHFASSDGRSGRDSGSPRVLASPGRDFSQEPTADKRSRSGERPTPSRAEGLA